MHLRGLELFAPEGAHRERRVGDGVAAVLALMVLVLLGFAAIPESGVDSALLDLLRSTPGWFAVLWRFTVWAGVAWVAFLLVASLVRRHVEVARDLVLAAAAATGIVAASNAIVSGDATDGFVLFGADPITAFPPVGIAVVAAAVSVGRPHITEPFGRLARWLLALATLGTLLLGAATPVGAVMALAAGGLAAALVALVFGTNLGVPEHTEVATSLAALGLDVESLEPATRQRAGVFTLEGSTPDGRNVLVKVYGRDARDTQALARTWRALWYRNAESFSMSRVQQVEREAFVTLLLGARGVAVPEVLAVGVVDSGDALLALASRGRRLEDLTDDEVTDDHLRQLWELLAEVHRNGLAFGDLNPTCFVVGGDGPEPRVQLDDLGTVATSSSSDDRLTDRAQLLVTTVCLAGEDRACAVALEVLGADDLAAVLPYLQPAALGAGLRVSAKAADVKVAKLRTRLAEAAEVDEPEMAKLRRVSNAALGRAALMTFIAYALISALTSVDTQELIDTFKDAQWSWVVVALLVSQLAIASQAITTQGASPKRIPYGPLTLLQFSIAFIMLAIPSSAARIAMVVRFFQKHGVPPAAATAISLVDSFAGFLVQVTVLLLTLVVGVGDVQLEFDFDPSSIDTANLLKLLAGLLAVAVVAVALALALPKVRSRIVARVKPWVGDMWGIVTSIRSLRRIVELFGGNFVAQVLFALSLGACVAAFGGGSVTLADMLVVYILAALFGGFMPVPGGIGVMEAALTAGLTAVGIDAPVAFGAAITFRMLTFYLPPAWGAAAFGMLQRRGDL